MFAVVDFPQPDSPTIPIVLPGISLRFTLFTAVILFLWNKPDPARVVNTTSASRSSMIGTSPFSFCILFVSLTFMFIAHLLDRRRSKLRKVHPIQALEAQRRSATFLECASLLGARQVLDLGEKNAERIDLP